MTLLSDLTPVELCRRLRSRDGLRVVTGPFTFSIRSPLESVAEGLALHYGAHTLGDDDGGSNVRLFADYHVEVRRPYTLRRWWRPQVVYRTDGENPFLPLPGNQGYPMLEWGMNWCISSQAHQYLIIHAAVLERHGRALIMPAPPGSGKSTLCAALAWRGWRLLSDELALIEPATGRLWGLARPVSLKNRSIDVIRAFEPRAVFNKPVHETVKGSVSHMTAPSEAVARLSEPARPGWVILPKWEADAPASLEPMTRARGFMELQPNTFNYHVHGVEGFRILGDVVAQSFCGRFRYGRLEEAVRVFDALPDPP